MVPFFGEGLKPLARFCVLGLLVSGNFSSPFVSTGVIKLGQYVQRKGRLMKTVKASVAVLSMLAFCAPALAADQAAEKAGQADMKAAMQGEMERQLLVSMVASGNEPRKLRVILDWTGLLEARP